MKLHISPCPNDTFMFDAIINERIDLGGMHFEVEYHDIELLNQGVEAHLPDISKISCAVLPAIADHYTLLESGAALGRGNGPLLVRRKGDIAPIKSVAVPGERTTANALLSRLLPEYNDRRPMLFSEIAEAVENGTVDAGVLIHEGRFVYAERNLELIADLGLLWEEKMSLPLPLGAIVIRKDIDAEQIKAFDELLHRSIAYAMQNPRASRDFIKSHAQEIEDSVIENHIALFVNDYSLALGTTGRKAIDELIG